MNENDWIEDTHDIDIESYENTMYHHKPCLHSSSEEISQDPFEIRMIFLDFLKNQLSSFKESIQMCVTFANFYNDQSSDLWSCIIQQIRNVCQWLK